MWRPHLDPQTSTTSPLDHYGKGWCCMTPHDSLHDSLVTAYLPADPPGRGPSPSPAGPLTSRTGIKTGPCHGHAWVGLCFCQIRGCKCGRGCGTFQGRLPLLRSLYPYRNSITRPWKMTLVANSLLISC